MTYCMQCGTIIPKRDDDMAKYYDKSSRKRAQKYLINNTFSASVRLNSNTEPELIEIYKRIPNKSQFIKQALRRWAEENSVDVEEIKEDLKKSGE